MLVLNLADWIERRKLEIGPYADHIERSVRHYEAEIQRFRTIAYEPSSRHEEGCDCIQCAPF